jgi:hypothetical protein
MDTRQIKTLLEKYFDGQTTVQEEQVLLDYFNGETSDPDLASFRQQFIMLRAWKDQEPEGIPGFESRLAGMIDSQLEIPVRKIRHGSLYQLAAAAAIAALIGISALLVIQSNWHKNRDTFTDPQQAYAEAQKTLLYVAGRMNKGIEPLSAVTKINAGNEHLKSLKKLNNSMEMLNVVSFINNSSNLKK